MLQWYDSYCFPQDCIHQIKISFNSAFDETHRGKLAEVKRIQEKNVRIRKILNDLELSDDVLEPVLSVEECPERLLEVEDDEVPFERFITEEEQTKIDEEKKRDEGMLYDIRISFLPFYDNNGVIGNCRKLLGVTSFATLAHCHNVLVDSF